MLFMMLCTGCNATCMAMELGVFAAVEHHPLSGRCVLSSYVSPSIVFILLHRST